MDGKPRLVQGGIPMACVELLYLKEGGQLDQCQNMDWSGGCQGLLGESVGRTATVAMAAECCEGHSKAIQRACPAEAPLSLTVGSSPSPECTRTGEITCHPSLPKEANERTQKKACCCELETSFTCVDENVNNLDYPGGLAHKSCSQGQDLLPHPDPAREMPLEWPYDPPSLVSEENDDAASEADGGKSIDYGFVSAIFFLVSGILLVIISYVVPRDVTVDPSTVAAREMERLENESAKIGAHLDRCVIAGLCLLTLGGVVLSSLLMMSMWKGELYRRSRFAASKESAKLYGSFNFRVKSSTNDNMELSLVEEDALAVDS